MAYRKIQSKSWTASILSWSLVLAGGLMAGTVETLAQHKTDNDAGEDTEEENK